MIGMTRERAMAIEKYSKHVKQLGYSGEEVTLLVIGFAAGWDEVGWAPSGIGDSTGYHSGDSVVLTSTDPVQPRSTGEES